MRIGAALFGLGLLLVAFVAYQLWGTALYEARAQSHLKSELARHLHIALPTELTATTHSGLPALAKVTAPTQPEPAVNQPVGLLSIPKISLLDAIVEGVGEAQLEQGPGHYPGTSLPGEEGNVAIAGHRTTYAHPFYNLDALAPGDKIYVLTAQGLFRYTVTGNQLVSPNDTAVLNSVPRQATLTLTTCNPRYSAAQRLVVTAKFDGTPVPLLTSAATKPRVTRLASDSTNSSLGGAGASWLQPVLWGLLALGIGVAAYILWHVFRRRTVRVAVVVLALPLLTLALLVCFEQVSLALPGSF